MVSGLEEAFEWRWNLAKGQVKLFPDKAKELYALRFKEYGIEFEDQKLQRNLELIRNSPIVSHLRNGLTQWFFLEPSQQGLKPLLDAEDSDPLQTQIRAAVFAGNKVSFLLTLKMLT